jgi:hypothetical protein
VDFNTLDRDDLYAVIPRGALMDERERRDPAAFEAWIDSPTASITELRAAHPA